ncbi:hypothetical protein OS493_040287, partial [Desmophyllum pertusum]
SRSPPRQPTTNPRPLDGEGKPRGLSPASQGLYFMLQGPCPANPHPPHAFYGRFPTDTTIPPTMAGVGLGGSICHRKSPSPDDGQVQTGDIPSTSTS